MVSYRKTVEVAPQATVRVALAQPHLPPSNRDVSVTIDDKLQKELLGGVINANEGGYPGRGRTYSPGPAYMNANILVAGELKLPLNANVYKSAVPPSRRVRDKTAEETN